MADSIKLRLELNLVVEYEARFDDYDCTDPQEIVKIDQQTAEEDPFVFLDMEHSRWDVKVSQVQDDDSAEPDNVL